MSSLQFTEADRDEKGFVTVEPRSLADLLPTPEEIKASAKPPTRKLTRKEMGALAGVALLCLFALVWAWRTEPEPVSAPVTPRPTAQPTLAPTVQPTSAPTVPPVRLLAAFAAPDGVTLGTVEATRPMTPTARYGDDWVQAQVQGSGLIWLRAADLDVALAGLLDLAPRPTAAPVYVPPAPVWEPEPEPTAPPAPTADPSHGQKPWPTREPAHGSRVNNDDINNADVVTPRVVPGGVVR